MSYRYDERGSSVIYKAQLDFLDDAPEKCEFNYTAGAEQAIEQAKQQGWTLISMKGDWATVFADVPSQEQIHQRERPAPACF